MLVQDSILNGLSFVNIFKIMKISLFKTSQFPFQKIAIVLNFMIAKSNKQFINSKNILRIIIYNIFPTHWKYLFCEISISKINVRIPSKNDDT